AAWTELLGNVAPGEMVRTVVQAGERLDRLSVERGVLHVEREIRVPLLLLVPSDRPKPMPVVLVLTQGGKEGFLRERTSLLARLLETSAVCLIDVRGTGETRAGRDRGRRSEATSLAASELMLGEPLLAGRLRDARAALQYLRTRSEFGPVAVLGDSLATVNSQDVNVERPLDVEQPALAEPLGPALALLIGLLEEEP